MKSQADRRRALKYGRIQKDHQRPEGQGGARGSGKHLKSKGKDTSEMSKRELTYIEREKRGAG